MDSRGQYSVDYMIAVAIFITTISFAFYYMVSTFTPYQSTFDIQASAYRVAMILAEDSGLNVSNVNVSGNTVSYEIYVDWEDKNGTINNTIADWYNLSKASGQNHKLNTTIVRVGLADHYQVFTFNSSYERCTPCVLNKTKVVRFFNLSWWNDTCRFNWNNSSRFGNDYSLRLDKFYRNLSILIGLGGTKFYHFNISLRYLNGTVCNLIDDNGNSIRCQIGYPTPKSGEIAKFERLVVIDQDVVGCLNKGRGYCINATSLKRLVVYVW